jgi:hypothetical protein
VDIFDPYNHIDDWITRNVLLKFDLYREHPDCTENWLHLSTRAPKSGTRTFLP